MFKWSAKDPSPTPTSTPTPTPTAHRLPRHQGRVHAATAPVARAIEVNRPYPSARPIRFRPSANISVFTPIPMRK